MNNILNNKQTELLESLLEDISKDQLLWLNGFISGQTYDKPILTGGSNAKSIITDRISILYGTNTGNSKAIAESLNSILQAKGFNTRLLSLEDYNKADLKKEKYLFLIVSTQGNGVPPVSALEFFDFLNSKRMPSLHNLSYSVLGLGDKSYKKFCVTGIQADSIFADKGAKAIVPLVKCDADYQSLSDNWLKDVEHALSGFTTEDSLVSENVKTNTSVDKEYSFENPYKAEIIDKMLITTKKAHQKVYHIELSIEESNIEFQPGDYVYVSTSESPSKVSDYKAFPINSDLSSVSDELHFTIDVNIANQEILSNIESIDRLNILIQSNNKFHLPGDDAKPIIMLSTDSSVSVYNAFLQNIESEKLSTDSLLLFTNRSFKDDFLYQLNFQKFIKLGILKSMDVVFDDNQDYYLKIADLLKRNSAQIFKLLDSGAVLYLSSSEELKTLIDANIESIIAKESGRAENQAKIYLKKLYKNNRIKINAVS